MKVLQLIDSLDAGGAERVAVNYANELASLVTRSHLCVTRKEGILKSTVDNEVDYLFLNKRNTLDISAISRLVRYVKKNDIEIIHAHSSSFFLATIIKFFSKKVKIVWHDHYGNSEFLEKRPTKAIKICSKFFSLIICVNRILEKWTKEKIGHENVIYIPNFAKKQEEEAVTSLNGQDNKRIICLANLRPQKDHLNLIKAFQSVNSQYPDWTLHLVGKDFNDDYSQLLKHIISKANLENSIFLYGSKPDIFNILEQSTIAVLSSKSEGLPVALLEYGLAGLAVVSTNVGEISNVINADENGLLVEASNADALAQAILSYIANGNQRMLLAENFEQTIKTEFSAKTITKDLWHIYKNLN